MAAELMDGLNDCSNEVYHADRKYLSSSVLKTIYTSLADYKHQYIDGNKKEFGNAAALEEGSAVHTLLLEPHRWKLDYNFFDGLRKAGERWEEFKANLDSSNRNKVTLSKPQQLRVQSFVEAYKARPEAAKYLTGGVSEQTICGTLHGVKIKTRFDYINSDAGFLADVKTTGYPADKDSFTQTLEGLKYELSAALYTAMAEQFYGKKFEFYFIVVGKKDLVCHVYKTSEATMARGRKMVAKACDKYLRAKESGIWLDAELPMCENISEYVVEEI